MDEEQLFAVMEILLQQQETVNLGAGSTEFVPQLYEYQTLSDEEITKFIQQETSVDIKFVQKLSLKDYQKLLEDNSKRYRSKDTIAIRRSSSDHEDKTETIALDEKKTIQSQLKDDEVNLSEDPMHQEVEEDSVRCLNPLQEQIINSICSPDIIEAIQTEFFRRRTPTIKL